MTESEAKSALMGALTTMMRSQDTDSIYGPAGQEAAQRALDAQKVFLDALESYVDARIRSLAELKRTRRR